MEIFGPVPVEVSTERRTEMGKAVPGHLPRLVLELLILPATWLLAAALRRTIARIIRGSVAWRSRRPAIRKRVTIGIRIAATGGRP